RVTPGRVGTQYPALLRGRSGPYAESGRRLRSDGFRPILPSDSTRRSPTVPQPIYQVDAFASGAFTGNPAAVCVLERDRDPGWMQAVAAEMNLSETAFVRRSGDEWSLRWFTPAVEVRLCGHATLASAHILYEIGLLQPHEPARFQTLSGLLTARRDGDAIVLDFPSQPPHRIRPPAGLAAALQADRSEERRVGEGGGRARAAVA